MSSFHTPGEPDSDAESSSDSIIFRMPSSIVAQEIVPELDVPAQARVDVEDSPGTLLRENGGRMPKTVSVRVEGSRQSHVFSRRISHGYKDEDSKTSTERGRSQESSALKGRQVDQPSHELKDLGMKARARLEEEKIKRPEIQVLDKMPTTDTGKTETRKSKTSFSAKVASQKTSTLGDAGTRKRKLNASLPNQKKMHPSRNTKKTGRKNEASSSWVPDTSHIRLPNKEDQSLTVKLHGLPIHCCLEQVKKFFAGLQLQSISILLPNYVTIPQLDASNAPPPKHPTGEIDRLRVLVHFRSVSAALLALERSGETIRMQSEDDNGDEEEFVVSVTLLPLHLAKALSLVTVPAYPRTSFQIILNEITRTHLHPLIDKILWAVVIGRLSRDFPELLLPMDRRIQKAEIVLGKHEERSLWDQVETSTSWYSHPGYRRFAKHYNRLVDLQDELLHQVPYPTVLITEQLSSSKKSSTSLVPETLYRKGDDATVVRLTTEACKALGSELDRIEGILYRVRISFQFSVKKK